MVIDMAGCGGAAQVARVRAYALALARVVGLAEPEIHALELAALLRNVGILAVLEQRDLDASCHTERLTAEDYTRVLYLIHAHPRVGSEIIALTPQLAPAAPLVLHHHERWDSRGYPVGLKENGIPLGARILALVQHYDALTSGWWGDVILPEPGSNVPDFFDDREVSSEAAIEALQQDAGKAFDPELVERFTKLVRTGPPVLVQTTVADEISRLWGKDLHEFIFGKDVHESLWRRRPRGATATVIRRRRVLIVDDEASTLDQLAKALAVEYQVDTAADATTALSQIRTSECDLLILGFPYREVDGLSLIRQVQRARAELPVVIITRFLTNETAGAIDESTSAIETLNLGVAGYLKKPFRVPEVLAAAAKALGTEATVKEAWSQCDMTPLTLSIEGDDGRAIPIVARNTTIPARKSEIFTTVTDNQTSLEFQVVQGERPLARDNRTIGRFQLVGIPPAPRGVPQIEVTFDIDANGLVNVSAKDMRTGKDLKITITASSGLSKDEVEQMLKDAEAHAEEDKKLRDESET
ncbi:MAG: Hsp70 family protein, partial [Acidobacteria bacterium]|nr:Hsp70 family protein [Acidobacteriota bacterium]